jgi:hypothetical protein
MNRLSPERKSTENPESQGDKKSSKKEEPVVHDPLPIELLVDEKMIQLAREEGISDESFLTGRMSPAVCNILAHAKLKHRTCKYIIYLILTHLIFVESALKLADWSRDNYFAKQEEVLEPTLRICEETYRSGATRDGVAYPSFTDGIQRVQCSELSEDQFIKKFEYGSMPVII